MIECFLEVLATDEEQGRKDIDLCRQLIDRYLTYEDQVETINGMFESKFSTVEKDEKTERLAVDGKILKIDN
jgi:hypothetical protein